MFGSIVIYPVLRSINATMIRNQPSESIRFYSRWMHRKPARVMLPSKLDQRDLKEDTVIDLNSSHKQQEDNSILEFPKEPSNPKLKFKATREKRIAAIKSNKEIIRNLPVFDENHEIIYEKCKDNDQRISKLLVALKSKKGRQKSHQILVEGWRLIVDGLEAKCNLQHIIFSKKEDLDRIKEHLPKTGVKILKVPYREISMWSTLNTSPGIFGVFELPTPENRKKGPKPLPLQIICDNVREPGNLGAIMRAAVGAGCERLLLTKGCVDPWEPKVLRSSAGAHFRIQLHNNLTWEDMSGHIKDNSTVLIADSNTSDEGCGSELPLLPYYALVYSNFEYVTLVIGGETEGISEDCYRFATGRYGLRVNIPLQKGVDSLNTGMALAVIAFEIRKQLLQAEASKRMKEQAARYDVAVFTT